MQYRGHWPYDGEIIWLTPEQGGRTSGPPPTQPDHDYAATGFVPPHTVDSGLASLVVRVDDRTAWRTRALAAWLIVDGQGDQSVVPGDLIVVTEGPRHVAFLRVDRVSADPVPAGLRNLDLGSLVGRSVEDARHIVESLGGELAAGLPGQPWRADLRFNRVKVVRDPSSDKITEILGLG